ncbi:hypothetical protein PMAYCL1PPCAC_14938 [Pristionchus mayeri]|uniref:Uncharacterized protein n=1 Tax=Pristionchus mayeri TaxID=1317129 RepID=A0AAN5HXC9_9BILA|nr:hypothetical protein PMAYCL1PPCAC_14938 [Pristionchus mayeri]
MQRELLLKGMGGGRGGWGDDNDDDYDRNETTTARPITTRQTPQPTTSLPIYTTPKPTCPPTLITEAEAVASVGVHAAECRQKFPYYYDNPKFTVIQGWPCISVKRCKTCIMFADPRPTWDWPCHYADYEQCVVENNRGSCSYLCTQFFDQFDFIPTGVDMPNMTDWAKGTQPAASACAKVLDSTARANCWNNSECKRLPSSSIFSTNKASPHIDPKFWSDHVKPGMAPCDVSVRFLDINLLHESFPGDIQLSVSSRAFARLMS